MELDETTVISPPTEWKYHVLTELGAGGMANVYLAVSQGLAGFSKLVVLKIMKSDLACVPELRDAFMREARICARMNHPNVVAVNEVEELDGLPVLVMEHLQGQSLSSILRRTRGKAALNVLLRIFIESLNGLHYAHELADFDGAPLQLVHCDFTPQNIFVTYDGSVKVLDFGVARVTRGSGHLATDTIQGKLRYMSPEQVAGGALDRRADVFAAGILLCELISGRRFWGDLSDSAVTSHLESRRFAHLVPTHGGIPSGLKHICNKALSRDRTQRHQTIAELQRDIESYLQTDSRRITPQEIGKFVAEWFTQERDEAQQLIVSAMAQETYVSWSRIATASSTKTHSQANRSSAAPSTVRLTSAAVSSSFAPRPRAAARWTRQTIAAALTLLVLGFGVLFLRAREPHAVAATAPDQSSQPNGAIRTVSVRVTAFPVSATIWVDDIAFSENPFSRRIGMDESWHELRIQAPGFEPNLQLVQFARNLELVVTLEKASEPPVTTVQAPAPRKPSKGATRTARAVRLVPPTPSIRPSCSPPFTLDERGVKRFKTECLQ